jgi:hypothetical protein
MRGKSLPAGIGALAFGILTFVAFLVASPPGGDYKVSDIVDYVARGHRVAVFVSVYLVVLSSIGLVLLVARLRSAIGDGARASIFWALGIAAAAAWATGYAIVVAVPAAFAFSGGHTVTLTNGVIYTFSEAGFAVMYGAGGVILGAALITFAIGPVAAPSWVRWSTLVAGVAGLAALAWFPFFLVYIWAILVGVWLIVTDRAPAPVAQTA